MISAERSEGENKWQQEVRSVLTRLAYPRLFHSSSMDSLTWPTSLVWGVIVEIGRKRTHHSQRSRRARVLQSWLVLGHSGSCTFADLWNEGTKYSGSHQCLQMAVCHLG